MMRATGCVLVLALTACAPPQRNAAPPPAPPPVDLGLRAHAGEYYADFIRIAGMERYGPAGLGLNAEDQARLARAMGVNVPAPIAKGGGSEALVFEGCIEHDCPSGVAVVAIDLATGAAFVGVRDPDGEEVLVPDDRIQALLETTSPTHRWDDPITWEGPIPTPPP